MKHGRFIRRFSALLALLTLMPTAFSSCDNSVGDTTTGESESVYESETQTQTETETGAAETEPGTQEEIMDDNIESNDRVSVDMFDSTDAAAHTPTQLQKGKPIGEYVKINAPFDGVTVGFPTWGKTGTYCTFSVYLWNTDCQTTVAAEPLVTTRVADIADCAFRSIPFGRELNAGEYYFELSGAEEGEQTAPGLWIYQSSVSTGTLYVNGKKKSGEIQMRAEFTSTPYIPFGSLEGLYTIAATEAEKSSASAEYAALLKDMKNFPVSFTLDGKEYRGFGADFTVVDRQTEKTDIRETTTITFAHKDGLSVKLICACYPDYAAFEWTTYFSNETDKNSGVLSDINGCDYTVTAGNPHLKGIYGDGGFDGDYYKPYDINITGESLEIRNQTGRATYNRFPYFNLSGSDGGLFFAVGWPGQWRAGFSSEGSEVTLTDGQVTLETYLKPGQTIRTPLSCFMFYKGKNADRAANLWRSFYIDCNMRKTGGENYEPEAAAATSWIYGEMVAATEENQIAAIKKYTDNGVKLTYWWMDAGWYYKTGTQQLDVWLPTGTWYVEEKRFPTKFRSITDYAAGLGMKTLLWFEPEVVRLDTSLLGETSVKKEWLLKNSTTKLVDYGNAEAREWLLNRVCTVIEEGGISLYRQDYGVAYPANEWKGADPKDQPGITENLYVQGYLWFFDALIERFPDMLIDSCAAGGGRNDLETMRRAVPLHKTDAGYSENDFKQSMNYSLFSWLPYFGTVTNGPDTCNTADKYALRSSYSAWIVLNLNVNANLDWSIVKECVDEWHSIKQYFYADYYPLTEWNSSDTEWSGWEFYDPQTGGGFFELFRPKNSAEDSFTAVLRGLKNTSTYRLTDADGKFDVTMTGYELKTTGIKITLGQYESALVTIAEQ